MRTVPLYGKKAAGRVALVSDEDYDLVMKFRWNVWEAARPNGARSGPYARTTLQRDGRKATVKMHTLITGWPLVDHADHDGLNNQRSNLRPADNGQNAANGRHQIHRAKSSRYKGVSRSKWGTWIAYAQRRHIGTFASEEDAARAYDEAAVTIWGEFAHLNFPRDTLAEPVLRQFDRSFAEEALKYVPGTREDWWAKREPEERICTVCESPYMSRSTHPSLYCSSACRKAAQRAKSQQPPADCPNCGSRFQPRRSNQIFCSRTCKSRYRSHRRPAALARDNAGQVGRQGHRSPPCRTGNPRCYCWPSCCCAAAKAMYACAAVIRAAPITSAPARWSPRYSLTRAW
jgi:hypothetical protein